MQKIFESIPVRTIGNLPARLGIHKGSDSQVMQDLLLVCLLLVPLSGCRLDPSPLRDYRADLDNMKFIKE